MSLAKAYLVEVVEGGPELLHLFLADPFGISGQDLVLHLVAGPGDGREELLPSDTDVLGVQDRREGQKKMKRDDMKPTCSDQAKHTLTFGTSFFRVWFIHLST